MFPPQQVVGPYFASAGAYGVTGVPRSLQSIRIRDSVFLMV